MNGDIIAAFIAGFLTMGIIYEIVLIKAIIKEYLEVEKRCDEKREKLNKRKMRELPFSRDIEEK